MSYRAIARQSVPALAALVLLAGAVVHGQSVTVTSSPGTINQSYIEGAKLPAAQTIAVNSSAAGATYTATIAPTGTTTTAEWLTLSSSSGNLPASVVLYSNPTGLDAGTYTAPITFAPAVAVPPGTAGVTKVKLIVTEPLPTLTVNPTSLTFSAASPPVAPQTVTLTTMDGPVAFSASAGTSAWLTVSPTSGVVLPAAPVTLTVSVNASVLGANLVPYTGRITLTEIGAATKTQTIAVSFTLNYQQPTVSALWPPTGKAGAGATTVTVFGTNFGSGSVVNIVGPPVVPLTTVYESPTALSAVIPASQLASGTALSLEVINPAPGGASATSQTFTFTPTIDEAVNSASFLPGGAPGEIISLFGANIGPTTAASFTDAANYISTSLGGVGVLVDNVAAPIVYVSQHQLNVQIPYEVALGNNMAIVVTNGTNPSANGTINVTATSPGIFASPDSTGVMWASALHTRKTTGVVSVNSSSNAAHIGDTITLYVTGEGTYSNTPTPVDGYVIPPGTLHTGPSMPTLNAAVTATIAGVNAPVTYSGPFAGGMLGVLEVDLTVPAHTTSTKGVPVSVTVGGTAAQAGVMVATQP
jgi:uncharacterized protein (TIGR03437 family)